MLNPGTVLSERYQIVRLIGEGGMGTVYEAEHVALHRKVAIKVLLPEFARSSDSVERFEREAHAAGTIGHEGIVEVVDFGTHDGLPYMVMEYLTGMTLADRLDRQRVVPISEASKIMGQVIGALGAAHAVGIVHRDLKPENVFIVERNGKQLAKLLDFGISKFKGEGASVSRSLTKTGALLGTPYYMAPEQALAKRDVDHRADLYSAGVMLYEMATGQLPFMAESQAELLMAIVYQRPPAAAPRAINPNIPPAYEALIQKAMAPDRAERFQDAGAFLEALRPYGLADDAPLPPPPAIQWGSEVATEVPAHRPTSMTWEGEHSTDPGAESTRAGRAGLPPRTRTLGLVALGAVVALGVGWVALGHGNNSPVSAAVAVESRTVPRGLSPTVQLDLQGVPADATVRLDGVPTAVRSLRLVRGSNHHLEVSAPGRITFETDLVAARNMGQAIVLPAVPSEPSPSPSPSPPTDGTHTAQGSVSASTRHGRVRSGDHSVGAVETPAPPASRSHEPHHPSDVGHVLTLNPEF